MVKAAIVASGMYVPTQVLDNNFFINGSNNPYRVYKGEDAEGNPVYSEKRVFLDEEKIRTNTGGMKERRKVAQDETIEDMLEKAFIDSRFPAEILDGIIIGTVSDNIQYPSTACRLQHRIGASRVSYTEDIKSACSGFTHALDHARLRIQESGGYYLVSGVEILTRMTDYIEINCNLFGDGCGLVILGPTNNNEEGILAQAFESDTSGLKIIYKDKLGMLRMPNGKEVFRKASRGMIKLAHELTTRAGISEKEVDLYIPHQANGRILDNVEERIDPEKTGKIFRNIEKYGNMSAATVPVALSEAIRTGKANPGNLITLVDMGSGFTLGGALIRL